MKLAILGVLLAVISLLVLMTWFSFEPLLSFIVGLLLIPFGFLVDEELNG